MHGIHKHKYLLYQGVHSGDPLSSVHTLTLIFKGTMDQCTAYLRRRLSRHSMCPVFAEKVDDNFAPMIGDRTVDCVLPEQH